MCLRSFFSLDKNFSQFLSCLGPCESEVWQELQGSSSPQEPHVKALWCGAAEVHRCVLCLTVFPSKDDLVEHVKNEHSHLLVPAGTTKGGGAQGKEYKW